MEQRKKGTADRQTVAHEEWVLFSTWSHVDLKKKRISAEIDANSVIWYFICHALCFDRIAPKENWKFRTEARRSLIGNLCCMSLCSQQNREQTMPLGSKPRKYDKQQTQDIFLVVVAAVDYEGKQNHKTLPWCPAISLLKNSHQKFCSPGNSHIQ